MSGSLNKCLIIGRLGADPEVKSFSNGGQVCNLRVATSESWKDKNTGERKERTEWHSVVLQSDGLIKIAQRYLKKGSHVYIEGQLRTRSWEQDGQKRYATEVVVPAFGGTLTMLDSAGGGSGQNQRGDYQSNQDTGPQQDFNQDFDDEIPFT
tara:strand:+ start:483 stop:938 length:456 start_codon:yes stop_codon:yes gene_type:complete